MFSEWQIYLQENLIKLLKSYKHIDNMVPIDHYSMRTQKGKGQTDASPQDLSIAVAIEWLCH